MTMPPMRPAPPPPPLAADVAAGAMPPALPVTPSTAGTPSASGRDYSGAYKSPVKPGAGEMPAMQTGPQEKRYEELSAQQRPELKGWRKVLDVIGSMFPIGRTIESAIPGTPQNFDMKLALQAAKAQQEQGIQGKGRGSGRRAQ